MRLGSWMKDYNVGCFSALFLTSVTVVIYTAGLSMCAAGKVWIYASASLDSQSLCFPVVLLLFWHCQSVLRSSDISSVVEPAIADCPQNYYCKVLRSMLNVVASKSRDEEVRVVVILLIPHIDALAAFFAASSSFSGRSWPAYKSCSPLPTSIRISVSLGTWARAPSHRAPPLVLLVLAKVALKAFWPQGQLLGLEMGANARSTCTCLGT